MPVSSSEDRSWVGVSNAFAVAHMELRQLRIFLALRRFNPSQPRVPAGHPDGGRWTGGSGGAPGSSEGSGEAPKPPASLRLAGGFTREDLGMSVQNFASTYCRGRIRSVLPQQFLDTTIADVMQAAKNGDRAARTCLKILGRDEYRK